MAKPAAKAAPVEEAPEHEARARTHLRFDHRHDRRHAARPSRPHRGDEGRAGASPRQARILQPDRQRQGPHRRGDDRRAGGGRPDPAGRQHADRADLGQYRHRACLRRRGARLPADPGDAGDDVGRAAEDAEAARARSWCSPKGRAACAARSRGPTSCSRKFPTRSSRSSSRTRPIRKSTGGRRPRRSGTTPMARSTSSSPASAPAARSPASARCSSRASRGCSVDRGRAGRQPGAFRRQPRAAQDPGDRGGLRAGDPRHPDL